MRIVATLYHSDEIDKLADLGADVFLLNTNELSTKAPHSFSQSQIKEITHKVHQMNRLVYLNLNTMIHEADLPLVSEYLDFISRIDIDGIVCFDLTILALARDKNLTDKIIYRPGTLNTNFYDPWFFRKMKIKGITLSKDIPLTDLINIGENYQGIEISVVGHGYLFLFYSKRPLLLDYFEYSHLKDIPFLKDESFRLRERSRNTLEYPIYEDEFGTHVFRAKKLMSFYELQVMRPYLSDFFIERIFYSDEEYYASVDAYHADQKKADFLQLYGKDYDSGYYYTRTLTVKGAKTE